MTPPPPKSPKTMYLIIILAAVAVIGYLYLSKKGENVNLPKALDTSDPETKDEEEPEPEPEPEPEGPCDNGIYNKNTKRVFKIYHHRSDIYHTLIQMGPSTYDSSIFKDSKQKFGIRYIMIPEFSGETLYTFNPTQYSHNPFKYYFGNFQRYDNAEKPMLESNKLYTIHGYEAC